MSDERPPDLTDERDLHTVAALAQLIQSAIAFSLCLEDRAETLTVLQRAQTAALPRPESSPSCAPSSSSPLPARPQGPWTPWPGRSWSPTWSGRSEMPARRRPRDADRPSGGFGPVHPRGEAATRTTECGADRASCAATPTSRSCRHMAARCTGKPRATRSSGSGRGRDVCGGISGPSPAGISGTSWRAFDRCGTTPGRPRRSTSPGASGNGPWCSPPSSRGHRRGGPTRAGDAGQS